MEGLSVVIITYNEEENIERCLKSVGDLSTDIVVVDSGSTDNTRKICESYHCRVFIRDFDDYSSQKNYTNTLAYYDLILSLDADECISENLKSSIKNFNFSIDNIALSFNRLNHHCGKPVRFCGWYPDRKIRIFNRKFAKWEGTIHENLVFSASPTNYRLKGDILHFTYKSRSEHLMQAEKFARLNALSDFKKGRKNCQYDPYLKSILRFVLIFILKLGFLNGSTGFFIAKISARATYLRNKELLKLNKFISNCEK